MPPLIPQRWSADSSSAYSEYSDGSNHSLSTAPTVHSIRPSVVRDAVAVAHGRRSSWEKLQYSQHLDAPSRSTAKTYASPISSTEDLDDDLPLFEVTDDSSEIILPTALPSSPREFADYFPSTQRLSIRHDDSTMDGNINLRIDTEARTSDGGRVDLTLFHLRMHDLKSREFSLRRYCRDSGREVCHSSQKFPKPSVLRRPGLQRSMSNAISSLRSKSDAKTLTNGTLERQDSGYDSMYEEKIQKTACGHCPKIINNTPKLTDTILLEFSNYAHLEVKRCGTKASKKYEFEYWGTTYSWKRTSLTSGNFKEISYHLVSTQGSISIAHIVASPLTPSETKAEDLQGGWVPPCSMWISDENVLQKSSDLADVIVASGLIALVDDCIRSRWHQKSHVHMGIPSLPRSSMKFNFESIGPKRLVDEVFNRPRKPATSLSTPLQHTTA